jgi:hypothetical protein
MKSLPARFSKANKQKNETITELSVFLIDCLYNFLQVLLMAFYIKLDLSRLKTTIFRSLVLYFLYKNSFYTEGVLFLKKIAPRLLLKNDLAF